MVERVGHIPDEVTTGLAELRQLGVRSGGAGHRLVELKRSCLVPVLGQVDQQDCPFLAKGAFDTRCNTGNKI